MLRSDVTTIVVIVVLLFVSALFSAAEISLLSLGNRRARRLPPGPLGRFLERMLSRPAVILGVLLVAITAVKYADEALAAEWVLTRFHLPVWVAAGGLGVLVLIFAEATPIIYAAANPERVAAATAAPVWLAYWILFLPARVLGFISERLASLLGGRPQAVSPVTEGEIRAIVDLQAATGGLEEEEKVMIHSIFEFGDKVAREVMVPRTEMVAIGEAASVREAARMTTEHRISRLPVYRGDLDHIVGVVYVRDVLPLLAAGEREAPVASIMKTPLLVPETRKLSDLLTDFRRARKTLAIIVDEYGGTSGLVTLEDLLEEVVGEIWDEYDVVAPPIERLSDTEFVFDGRVSIGEASEKLGVELPEGDYDSLAGLLYDRLGVVREAGESTTVDGVRFTIEALDGRRIARVRAEIERRPPVEDGA